MLNLYNKDCLEILKTLESNSIDALITDPPAFISFMNKSWDSNRGGRDESMKWLTEVMTEALRVLKAGAHGLVWALPRTSHWTAMALENAGFEIRDCVYHIQSQGFPKSLNVSKGIDKKFGAERKVVGVGVGAGTVGNTFPLPNKYDLTESSTPEAKQYDGYGSQLKPAVECWWLIRKPLSEKSIVDNVIKWGTGGINIDKSRIPTEEETRRSVAGYNSKNNMYTKYDAKHTVNQFETRQPQGRFPANLILDGSDAVLKEFAKYGESKSSKMGNATGFKRNATTLIRSSTPDYGSVEGQGYDDSGSVARFFYCSKASVSERNLGLDGFEINGDSGIDYRMLTNEGVKRTRNNTNNHPTVKSVKLMSYLVNLIMPPIVSGATIPIVLDCFLGSGTTGIAALLNGYSFIGIEMNEDYFKIAQARINDYENYRKYLK